MAEYNGAAANPKLENILHHDFEHGIDLLPVDSRREGDQFVCGVLALRRSIEAMSAKTGLPTPSVFEIWDLAKENGVVPPVGAMHLRLNAVLQEYGRRKGYTRSFKLKLGYILKTFDGAVIRSAAYHQEDDQRPVVRVWIFNDNARSQHGAAYSQYYGMQAKDAAVPVVAENPPIDTADGELLGRPAKRRRI